jgi:hypothetical protein
MRLRAVTVPEKIAEAAVITPVAISALVARPVEVTVAQFTPPEAKTNVVSAIQCLREGQNCSPDYNPGKIYNVRGVFQWSMEDEVVSGYSFATDVKDAVLNNIFV